MEVRRVSFMTVFVAGWLCVAVPASALLSCMADQHDTAMTQMACCKTAKPECGHASMSMQCCKSGDHPDQQNIAKAPSVVISLKAQLITSAVASLTLPALPAPFRPLRSPLPLFAGSTSPPHLVFSSFLI